jgi:hypothetical protein
MKHRYKDLMHVLHRPVELTANSDHWFYALLSGSTPSHKSIESDPIDLFNDFNGFRDASIFLGHGAEDRPQNYHIPHHRMGSLQPSYSGQNLG